MADSKISALPASTTPLAGTEVLPIVQSSATKQVSVANLTAGRAISATQLTLTTGNLIVANGQGIDFSATPGTGTSELLADYEEGTWTVTDASSASLSFTANTTATYTKLGRQVYCTFDITYPSTVSVAGMAWSGLPFNSSASNNGVVCIGYTTYTNIPIGTHGAVNILFYNKANSPPNDMLNADASLKRFVGSITYFV